MRLKFFKNEEIPVTKNEEIKGKKVSALIPVPVGTYRISLFLREDQTDLCCKPKQFRIRVQILY